MKMIFLLLFFSATCTESRMVYVCDSRNAHRYHLKEHCRGLSNCSYRTIRVTEERAIKDGKTLCHWETGTAVDKPLKRN
jgi:5-bromo-4-chloroindolyl phosphate hydrolysis protein